MKQILCACIVHLTLWPTDLRASDFSKPITYAGFGYITSFSRSKNLYPHTNSINLNNFREKLRNVVKSVSPPNYSLSFEALDNSKSGYCLAIALDREELSVEKIGNGYKIVAGLEAQMIVFDFSEKKIIAVYPFGVQLTDYKQSKPSNDYRRSLIKELYMGRKFKSIDGKKLNLISEFTKLLARQSIKPNYAFHMQVTEVEIGPKIRMSGKIPDFLTSRNYMDFEQVIAEMFNKRFATDNQIGLLPYISRKNKALSSKFASSSVIKRTMGLKLKDGNFNFEIPDADYGIHLTLDGLKKFEYGKGTQHAAKYESYKNYAYACQFDIEVKDPINPSQKVYFKGKIKSVYTKQQSKGSRHSDWTWFYYSMLNAISDLSVNIKEIGTKAHDQWIKNYTKNVSRREMKKLASIIGKCK